MQTLALATGWESSTDSGCDSLGTEDAGYTLINGVAYPSGTMINSVGSANGTFATLPPGARPTHALYLILNEGPAPRACLEIDPDGNMTALAAAMPVACTRWPASPIR